MSLFRLLIAGFLAAAILGGSGSARAQSPEEIAAPGTNQGVIIEIYVDPVTKEVEAVCLSKDCFCSDPSGATQVMEDGQFKKIAKNCSEMENSDGLALQQAVEEALALLGDEFGVPGIQGPQRIEFNPDQFDSGENFLATDEEPISPEESSN